MYLSVTDYQEFAPILQAVAGHKDVIMTKVFIKGVLSELEDQSRNKQTEKEGHLSGVEGAADQDAADAVQAEIDALMEKKSSKVSTLMKADNFLRCVLLHSTPGDPNITVRRIMRTSSSDSDIVTGLEIWHQMAVTYAGSAQTWVVTLLKQIMTSTESRKSQPVSFKCTIIGSNSSTSMSHSIQRRSRRASRSH